MKQLLSLWVLLFSFIVISAQSKPDENDKPLVVPTFSVNKIPDSTILTQNEIRKDQPLLIMYFSPDCEHCQKETKELLAYKEELKDVQILMLSVYPISKINEFYQDYGLSKMPNIILAQDLNYVLARKFHMRTFPSLFLYGKDGKLLYWVSGNAPIPTVLEHLTPKKQD